MTLYPFYLGKDIARSLLKLLKEEESIVVPPEESLPTEVVDTSQ